MVQTRSMSKNNITVSDIESRHFHVNNYKEQLCWWNHNYYEREKINYIFKFFDRRDRYPESTSTITGRNNILDRVGLISFRYEMKKNMIKEALSRECTCCGEAW